jgi:hypothetical protein
MLLQHLNDLGTDSATILVGRHEKGTVDHLLRGKVGNSGVIRLKLVEDKLGDFVFIE